MAALEKHVLGLSGGRDSAALAVLMRQRHPEIELTYFFTDTGKELPEVYEFLGKLEGFLGEEIVRLNPQRDFDFWLDQYHKFLPSPRSRWCTRQLKIRPFEAWIKQFLSAGQRVASYVAIRADEDHREGYTPTDPMVTIRMPLRQHGIDKEGVIRLLEDSGVGLPRYYDWRSRSGCTFCFYQQKIEWVHLIREHPDAFEDAKRYEKTALEHGSPFTWSHGESLEELQRPDRIKEIEKDYMERLRRAQARRRPNPLHASDEPIDIDDVYGLDEGGGACLVCHK
jgi:hypothetical protein